MYPQIFDASSFTLFKDAFSLGEGKVDRDFLTEAKKFLQLVMLRRVKDSTEVGVKIPEKREISLSVPLSDLQQMWYLQILRGCEEWLIDNSSEAFPETQFSLGDTVMDGGAHQLGGGSGSMRKGKLKFMRNVLMELRKVSKHFLTGHIDTDTIVFDSSLPAGAGLA